MTSPSAPLPDMPTEHFQGPGTELQAFTLDSNASLMEEVGPILYQFSDKDNETWEGVVGTLGQRLSVHLGIFRGIWQGPLHIMRALNICSKSEIARGHGASVVLELLMKCSLQ